MVRDLDALDPAFLERLVLVLDAMRVLGHQPLVWETLRTEERGEWLRASGRSKNGARSMHCFMAAADIICGRHRWQCHKHGCTFFEDLGPEVRHAGLYWGGDWHTFRDMPHIQAVRVRDQDKVRNGDPIGPLMRRLRANRA